MAARQVRDLHNRTMAALAACGQIMLLMGVVFVFYVLVSPRARTCATLAVACKVWWAEPSGG